MAATATHLTLMTFASGCELALLMIAWGVGLALSTFRFTNNATRLSALTVTVVGSSEEIEVHKVLVSQLELLLGLPTCSFLRHGDLLLGYGHS